MRSYWPRLAVVAYTVLVWATIGVAIANCGGDHSPWLEPPAVQGDTVQVPEPPIRWDAAIVVGDSMRLPLQWRSVCDAGGCPDAFRLEYTKRHKDSSIAANVSIRSVRVTATADTATVRRPLLGQPQAVCVSIRSERRGLLSVPVGNCRLVETPDVAPPPPDSINWGALGVVTNAAALGIRWDTSSWKTRMGRMQYLLDSLGVVQDSALVRGDTVRPGWTAQFCPTWKDTTGSTWVVVPKHTEWTPDAVRAYQRQCTRDDEPPRWVLERVTFTPVPN
jgi:hypothetical protein